MMSIQKGTMIKVSDNSGAKAAKCIGLYNNKSIAKIGDVILVSVRRKYDRSVIKKGEIFKAIIIRTRSAFRRGALIFKFNDNAVVLIDDLNKKTIKGNRVFGSTMYEVKNVFPSATTGIDKIY